MNVRGEYLSNEIWSPVIPIGGSGSEFRLRYTVYRDLPLDNLIFHVWKVRSIPASGCPGPWRSRDLLYYGDSKDWAMIDVPRVSLEAAGAYYLILFGILWKVRHHVKTNLIANHRSSL